jgi:hypothetical protein
VIFHDLPFAGLGYWHRNTFKMGLGGIRSGGWCSSCFGPCGVDNSGVTMSE